MCTKRFFKLTVRSKFHVQNNFEKTEVCKNNNKIKINKIKVRPLTLWSLTMNV